MEDVKRILVVSRMTKYCGKAVRYGISLAQNFKAELFVMHVLHNPYGLEGWNIPIVSLKEEYAKDLLKSKKDLHEIIMKENKSGMSITEITKEGNPTDEIIDFVRSEAIDLMILLTHEEGRLEHFLFGRSNEELLRRMPCSMLFLRKEYERLSF